MVETSIEFIWTRWSWEPSVLLGIELVAALYLVGVYPLRRRFGWAPEVPRRQVASFMGGLLVIFLALASPLDYVADRYLFSAHMVQHMLLVLIAPPLIWAGTPDWLLRPLISRLRLTRIVGWITFPVVTFTIFNINFWIWHHPALYQLALESLSVHILMHLLFIATGLLNWWPTLSPLPELRPQSYLPRMLYLFAQMWPDTGLSLLLIFTPKVLYPAYALAPRLWGLTPLDDQQLGGILMWVPGGIVYVTVISVLFFRWFGENESAEREAIYRAAR